MTFNLKSARALLSTYDGPGYTNARFIAAAHTLLPQALDRIEQLEVGLREALAIGRRRAMWRDEIRRLATLIAPEEGK